ncbi:GlxA family transcriptional regulator [Albidovulum sp.]
MRHQDRLFARTGESLRVAVLVMEDSNALSLAACIDPMRVANRKSGRTLFDWRFLSPRGGPVALTAGFEVTTAPLREGAEADVLMVVAGFRVDEQARPALLAELRRLAPGLGAMIGVDGGSWFLARSGLLDGRAATVHWEDLEPFADRFPQIEVRQDRYVISGNRITVGGAAAALDLMLALIRARYGAELALQVAGTLLYEPVRAGTEPQHAVPVARIAQRVPVLGAAVTLMQQRIEDPVTVAVIARRLGLSQRRLEMLFAEHLGTGPGRFYLDLRLEEARRLVTDTPLALGEVALRTGFSGPVAFARAFRRRFGIAASRLRRERS